MILQIKILNNESSENFQSASYLESVFNKSFPNATGKIIIYPDLQILGQETKDIDIVVLGEMSMASESLKWFDYKFETVNGQKRKTEQKKQTQGKVFINSFCFTIEIKGHIPNEVEIRGQNLFVPYRNSDFGKDVTRQSENQKFSLVNFFKSLNLDAPKICNFIWFKNLDKKAIKKLVKDTYLEYRHNFLPNEFSTQFLFSLAALQNKPEKSNIEKFKNSYVFNSFGRRKYEKIDFSKYFRQFEMVKSASGELTREKLELVTKKLLANQKYAQNIGEKLIIISGKPGTGKTIKLIRIGFDLVNNRGANCLLLTYNKALVSDIKRTIHFATFNESVRDKQFNVQTSHKFFYHLLKGFEIFNVRSDDFLEAYDDYLGELLDYLNSGTITKNDINQKFNKILKS